jgi:hypothetical protein
VLEPAERVVRERCSEPRGRQAVEALQQRVVQRGRATGEAAAIRGREQIEAIRQIETRDAREVERRQLRRHRCERAARRKRCAELPRGRPGVDRVIARHHEDGTIAERAREAIHGFFGDGVGFRCGQQRQQIRLQRRGSRKAPRAIERRHQREREPRGAQPPRPGDGERAMRLH